MQKPPGTGVQIAPGGLRQPSHTWTTRRRGWKYRWLRFYCCGPCRFAELRELSQSPRPRTRWRFPSRRSLVNSAANPSPSAAYDARQLRLGEFSSQFTYEWRLRAWRRPHAANRLTEPTRQEIPQPIEAAA